MPPFVYRLRLRGAYFAFVVVAVCCLTTSSASAQTTLINTTASGATPAGLAPGAPAGSYALSDFDNINFYNGSINFHIPLVTIGGRGGAGYTMTLPIEQKWRVEHAARTTRHHRARRSVCRYELHTARQRHAHFAMA